MTLSALSARRLSSGYGDGKLVLRDVSIDIPAGQVVALIGPNGCGKSTLLATLTGILRPSAGSVTLGSTDITGWETERIIRSGVGYLRQRRNIFPSLTVQENLDLVAGAAGSSATGGIDYYKDYFAVLEKKRNVLSGLLSGGERHLLALTMAMIGAASVRLLDEPLAGLTQKLSEAVIEALRNLRRGGETMTFLVVEHRLRLIRPLVDRVLIMRRGVIAEDCDDPSILSDAERLKQYYIV